MKYNYKQTKNKINRKFDLQKFDNEFQDRFRTLPDLKIGFRHINDRLVPLPHAETISLATAGTNVEYTIDHFNQDIRGPKKWASNIMEITRIELALRFTGTSAALSKFGDETALSNGISIYYTFNGTEVDLVGSTAAIKDNGDFLELDPRGDLVPGAANLQNIVKASLQLDEFSRIGLLMDFDAGDNLVFEIGDDIEDLLTTDPTPGSIISFTARIRGTGWLRK